MKKSTQLLLTLCIILCGTGFVSAQTSGTTTAQSGDNLCTLTNGNTIPCVFAEEAEVIIANDGRVLDPRTGQSLCEYKNRAVACSELNSEGGLKMTSYRENFHDFVMYLFLNKKILGVTILAMLLVAIGYTVSNRRKNIKNSLFAQSVVWILAIVLFLIGILFTTDTTSADIPVAPNVAVECGCVSSASQTCLTSTPGIMWMSFSNLTTNSCDESNTYRTYLWPNTPPQFFYLGIQSVIGDISTANKYEAKGREATVTQVLPAEALGQDTGITCQRSGGVTGTLKYTGKLNYTVQGICLIGMCQYYSKIATNYSCY